MEIPHRSISTWIQGSIVRRALASSAEGNHQLITVCLRLQMPHETPKLSAKDGHMVSRSNHATVSIRRNDKGSSQRHHKDLIAKCRTPPSGGSTKQKGRLPKASKITTKKGPPDGIGISLRGNMERFQSHNCTVVDGHKLTDFTHQRRMQEEHRHWEGIHVLVSPQGVVEKLTVEAVLKHIHDKGVKAPWPTWSWRRRPNSHPPEKQT